MFLNPFHCNIDDVPLEQKTGIIELQENGFLKEKHREGNRISNAVD